MLENGKQFSLFGDWSIYWPGDDDDGNAPAYLIKPLESDPAIADIQNCLYCATKHLAADDPITPVLVCPRFKGIPGAFLDGEHRPCPDFKPLNIA